MDHKQLYKHIKSREFKNLYLFYGVEDYLKEFFRDELVSEMKNHFGISAEVIKFDGKPDPRKIQDAFDTLPMFGGNKIIIIKNTDIFAAEKNIADNYLFMENIPSYCYVIFTESKVKKNMKMYKIFEKKGICVEFDYLKGDALESWVRKEFKKEGKNISNNAVKYFVSVCEQDMYSIYNEIKKLVEYADDEEITKESIDAVTSKALKSIIFELTDSISYNNAQKAYEVLNDLENMKEPLQKVFFMLCRHMKYIKQAKDLLNSKVTPKETANYMKLKPFESFKFCDQSQRFSTHEINNAVSDCLRYDVAVKNGEIDVRSAIELIIAKYGNRKAN